MAIAGASFAGLAVASALAGRDVVVIDPVPPGAGVKSACALPLTAVQAFGAEAAILEVHGEAFLHMTDHTFTMGLEPPYVTADYRKFCETLAAATGVKPLAARALACHDGRLLTSAGEIPARFVVDATGPAATLTSAGRGTLATREGVSVGLETELARPADFPRGLHFYSGERFRPGYAWAFGAGRHLRVGVLTYGITSAGALAARLHEFVDELGLQTDQLHGGPIPARLRPPVKGGVFAVGDAAGQVMPLSAEGIRPALWFGTHLGTLIRRALDDGLTREWVAGAYACAARRPRLSFSCLGALQRLAGAMPDRSLSGGLAALQRAGLVELVSRQYQSRFDVARITRESMRQADVSQFRIRHASHVEALHHTPRRPPRMIPGRQAGSEPPEEAPR